MNYPTSSWWVTGVGGTNLALNADNAILNSGRLERRRAPARVGGRRRPDLIWKRPSYQDGVVTAPVREVPDVSMLADVAPGYAIYCSAQGACVSPQQPDPWQGIGGTSAATPLLAGGFAIIDQDLRQNGRQDLGLANPLLYQIASSNAAWPCRQPRRACFWTSRPAPTICSPHITNRSGAAPRSPGYDNASGLGEINLANLTAAAKILEPALATVSATAVSPQSIAHRKLVTTVTCSVACIQSATATIRIAGGGDATVTALPSPAAAATPVTVKLGIGGKLGSKIKRALAGHHQVTATIVGTAWTAPARPAQERARLPSR